MVEFQATLEALEGRGNATCVTVPPEVLSHFGGGGQIKIKATINGVDYRGSVVPMGDRHVLGIRRSIREAAGKQVGDPVAIRIEKDDEPRTVDIPKDLKSALDGESRAGQHFGTLSYTHQREYIEWIESSRKPQTRIDRIAKTIGRLLAK